jgi:predicted enzyme related to lactoylglutathione lyase
MAKITGMGLFIKANDPKALSDWYRTVLGLAIDPDWMGVALDPADMAKDKEARQVFSMMGADTTYFEPSEKSSMLNFCVDDMDGMLEQLEKHAVVIGWQDHATPFGRFVHILDPEGTKIELWQPKA